MSNVTLYAVEERLALLMDAEDSVPDEQLAEFTADLAEAHEAALTKRDRVIQFIRHVEAQIEFAREEEKRLAERRKALDRHLERFKQYVLRCIEQSGQKKLDGRVGTLVAKASPAAVEVLDMEAVPMQYRRVKLTMPGDVFEELCRLHPEWCANYSEEVDKNAVRKAIQAGEDVPGIDLQFGRHLEVK